MTREEKQQQINAKYDNQIKSFQNIINQTQKDLDDLLIIKENNINEVNAYYDALETKISIDAVILKGEPVI